jgi:hypothetical protein
MLMRTSDPGISQGESVHARALSRLAVLILLAATLLAPTPGWAEIQKIQLKPGWNAVWLTVDPTDPKPAAVFGNLPISQVWCWFPTESPVEFIDNPENLFNVDGWRCYIPENQPNAFLSNLGSIQAHRPYLIKLAGSSNGVLMVNGATVFKPLKWRADSFNLVGFHVDPVIGGGASGAFFLSADAHRKQSMHRLEPTGNWTLLPENAPIRAGEAYWIFSKGMSQFNGPVSVAIDDGNFDFGALDAEKQVTLNNHTAFQNTIKLEAGGFPLFIASENGGQTTWTPITTLTRTVPAGGKTAIRLGVQRANLSSTVEGTITISAAGASLPYPAKVSVAGAASSTARVGGRALKALGADSPDTGLWIGVAIFNKVNDVNGVAGVPVPTPASLAMRFIVHVDAGGAAKLLKQVTLMRKTVALGQSAEFVLVTDDTRLPDFTGAVLKDGGAFGYRVSSIGYDFAGNERPFSGSFGGTLAGSIVVDRNLSTHPMKHKYHPDHDDLDAQFKPLPNPAPPNGTPDQDEVWKITRALELAFNPPSQNPNPADSAVRTGTYRETITGLHKQALIVEGTFTLRRVNQLSELNPAP